MSATPVSHVSVITILAAVAVAAPAGATMKITRYITPAILALRRGDAPGVGFLIFSLQWCHYLIPATPNVTHPKN